MLDVSHILKAKHRVLSHMLERSIFKFVCKLAMISV